MIRINAHRAAFGLAWSTVALAGAGAAHAQAWIGAVVGNMIAQENAARLEQACMTGTPMPPSEIEETRATANAAIRGYWSAVQGGHAANVAAFYQNDNKAAWTSGPSTVRLAGLAQIIDPFAATTSASLADAPLGYVRSGDGATVRGAWQVRDAHGTPIGTYDAMFRRSSGVWRLSRLILLSSRDYVEPVIQYCHKPNDVLPYRVANSQMMRDYATKRAEKLRLKADKARADADHAAAKYPGDAATLEISQRAEMAETKAKTAAEEARLSVAANETAKADASAAEAEKQATIARLAKMAG